MATARRSGVRQPGRGSSSRGNPARIVRSERLPHHRRPELVSSCAPAYACAQAAPSPSHLTTVELSRPMPTIGSCPSSITASSSTATYRFASAHASPRPCTSRAARPGTRHVAPAAPDQWRRTTAAIATDGTSATGGTDTACRRADNGHLAPSVPGWRTHGAPTLRQDRSISSRSAPSSSTASKSLGRPAVRFIRMRSSSEATRTR